MKLAKYAKYLVELLPGLTEEAHLLLNISQS